MSVRVLLVTSPNNECGIAEYGNMLAESLARVAPDIELQQRPDPNPHYLSDDHWRWAQVIHVNHQAALHSQWGPESVSSYKRLGFGVVVTQHDTFEHFDLMRERGMPDFRNADALIVHEPVEGLSHERWAGSNNPKVHYIRQPVPPLPPWASPAARGRHPVYQNVVGSVGFPFPWKNYPLLAAAAKQAGWGLLLIAPGITKGQTEEIISIHPGAEITPWFMSRDQAIGMLHEWCSVTAFLYSTGNSGTSGALRLGIAARRAVLATSGGRQFRDLAGDDRIMWVPAEVDVVACVLDVWARIPDALDEWEQAAISLAEEESWDRAALRYAAIYREVAAKCSR